MQVLRRRAGFVNEVCPWKRKYRSALHPSMTALYTAVKCPSTVLKSSLLGQELNEIIESRFRYGKILIGLLELDTNIYLLMFYIVQLNAKMFKYSWIKAKLL